MPRQFQYQQRFNPLSDQVVLPIITAQAIYPDFLPRKKDSHLYFGPRLVEPPYVPPVVIDFFGAIYPDYFVRAKRTLEAPSKFTPHLPAPTFFSSSYPDFISRPRPKDRILTQFFRTERFLPPPPAPPYQNFLPTPDFLYGRSKSYFDIKSGGFVSGFVPVYAVDDWLSFIEFFNLRVRLDVKKAVDSGNVNCLAADPTGTTVLFNRPFKDVESIVGTVQEVTEFIVVIDFVDVPNPTQFKVFVFNTSGVRVSKMVRWVARGII